MNLLIAVFVLFFALVLRRETLHYFKRLYLLIIPFVAIVFPFIQLNIKENHLVYEFSETITFMAEPVHNTVESSNSFSWEVVGFIVFLAIVALLILHTLWGLVNVYSIIGHSSKKPLDIGVLCNTEKPVSPFSFFQFIVVHQSNHLENELQQIIKHEQVHVYQRHFIDMLLTQLMTIFCWVNPAVWLYRHYVIENLEFIVDQEVLKTGINKKQYQFSILNTSVYDSSLVFANHFNQSLIKKRIQMMNKKLSNPKNMWKAVFLLPILLLVLSMAGQVRANVNGVHNSGIEAESKTEKEPFISTNKKVERKILEMKPSDFKREQKIDTLPPNIDIYIDGKKTEKELNEAINANNIGEVQIDKKNSRIDITTKKRMENVNVEVYPVTSNIEGEQYQRFLNGSNTKYFIDGDKVSKRTFIKKKDQKNYKYLLLISDKGEKEQGQKMSIFTRNFNEYSKEELDKIKNIHFLPPPPPPAPPAPPEMPTSGSGTPPPPPAPPTTKNKAINYPLVEQKPEYPNGTIALRKEVQQKMTMPESLKLNSEFKRGTLVARFVIEKNGSVQQVKLVKNIEGCVECEQQVKEIFTNLNGTFSPGLQNNKPVRVWYTFPIVLKINNDLAN